MHQIYYDFLYEFPNIRPKESLKTSPYKRTMRLQILSFLSPTCLTILTDKRKATSKICDKLPRRLKLGHQLNYIHVYKPTYLINKNDKLKQQRDLTQDFGHGKLEQLVFVSHMQYMRNLNVAFLLSVSII